MLVMDSYVSFASIYSEVESLQSSSKKAVRLPSRPAWSWSWTAVVLPVHQLPTCPKCATSPFERWGRSETLEGESEVFWRLHPVISETNTTVCMVTGTVH